MNQHSFLKGKKVLITRGEEDSGAFASSIACNGGIPINLPLIRFQACDLTDVEKQMISSVHTYDWLVFTSKNGVDYYFQQYKEKSLPKIAVIGKQTEEHLKQYGHSSDFVPSKFVAETFVQEFIPLLRKEERVLVIKGNLARTVIRDHIRNFGCICDEVILYKNEMPQESEEKLHQLLLTEEVQLVTFTSSSTVQHFMRIVNRYQLYEKINKLTFACIGPIAKKTAEECGLSVAICAEVYTMEGLLQAIIHFQD